MAVATLDLYELTQALSVAGLCIGVNPSNIFDVIEWHKCICSATYLLADEFAARPRKDLSESST